MSSSVLYNNVFSAKINNVQNQADTSAVYSAGVWSFKNSTALTSVTITDAGNVGVGVTPSAWGASNSGHLQLQDGVTYGRYGYTRNAYFDGASWRYIGTGLASQYLQAAGTHQWLIAPSGTAGNAITYTEAMRIDASGNLLVGKTAVDLTTTGMSFATASGVRVVNSSTSGSVDAFEAYSSGAGAYRFYVAFNGVISATSTTINAISDRRLKENIRDLDEGLSAVLALKPRKFDWKEGKGADIKDARGFIAQEFERVFPDLISEWKDPAPEGEEPYKSVRPDLIPVLVKAIQEQQAMIESMKAEIEALKAK